MSHLHSVYDTDAHFKISDTRVVSDTSTSGTRIVQNDHNSERVTFEVPRYIDGHDMSVCNIAQIHYLNVDAKNKNNQRSGVYVVDDMQLSPDDENVVIFSWLISNGATQYAGPLSFIIRLACTEDGETVDYAWHTVVCSSITVSDGLYFGDEVADAVADAIYQWEAMLSSAGQAMIAAQTARDEAVESAESAGTSAQSADASAKSADASAQAAAASALEAGNPPYIGENGNWFAWDLTTGQFVDTGVSAQGEQGIQGIQGEVGYSGVYVGSDTPTDNANVWVDPDGTASSVEAWTFTLEDGTTATKNVVVVS